MSVSGGAAAPSGEITKVTLHAWHLVQFVCLRGFLPSLCGQFDEENNRADSVRMLLRADFSTASEGFPVSGRFLLKNDHADSAKATTYPKCFSLVSFPQPAPEKPAGLKRNGDATEMLHYSISSPTFVLSAREVDFSGAKSKATFSKWRRRSDFPGTSVCDPPEWKMPPGKCRRRPSRGSASVNFLALVCFLPAWAVKSAERLTLAALPNSPCDQLFRHDMFCHRRRGRPKRSKSKSDSVGVATALRCLATIGLRPGRMQKCHRTNDGGDTRRRALHSSLSRA